MTPTDRFSIGAVLRSVCPRCRQGAIFKGPLLRTGLAVHDRCPVCGLQFDREQGYFLGAMIVSYFLSIPILLLLMAVCWWLTKWSWPRLTLVAWLAFILLAPAMVRFSRVLWIHLDRSVDPDRGT